MAIYFIKAVISKWWLIAVGVLIAALLTTYRVLTTPSTYQADLTFTINEDTGGGLLSSLGGITSLLGSSTASYNVLKLLELVKTRQIIVPVMFQRIEVEGQSNFLANHIIDLYEYQEAWAEDPENPLIGFYFERDLTQVPQIEWTRLESRAVQIVHKKMVGTAEVSGLLTAEDSEGGILSISVNSRSEELSLAVANLVYEELSEFYVNESTNRQRRTYELALATADSLKAEMEKYEQQRAAYSDRSLGVQYDVARLRQQQLQREATEAALKYSEIAKNVELSKFTLLNSTPFIQIVDRPLGPLRKQEPDLVFQVILWSIVSAILIAVVVVVRRIVLDNLPSSDRTTTATTDSTIVT